MASVCLSSDSLLQHQEEHPTSKERWLCGCKRAKRSYSAIKVRRGGGEEIPFIQGKEPRLRFAGAAVKRYPTSKVRETQVGVVKGHQRADTLKP